jgi:hypothetical protein
MSNARAKLAQMFEHLFIQRLMHKEARRAGERSGAAWLILACIPVFFAGRSDVLVHQTTFPAA